MFEPAIAPLIHAKKCVFGVFLKNTRIALIKKNLVIDIFRKVISGDGFKSTTNVLIDLRVISLRDKY